jgi:hypothetical protein
MRFATGSSDCWPGIGLDDLHLRRFHSDFFLSGVAKYLFSPLAEAVIFAMITSYILSRTLVPALAMYWISKHGEASHQAKARKPLALLTWRPGKTGG